MQCFRERNDGFLYLLKGCLLFMPSAASAVVVLPTRWIGSIGFARSPTGRAFELSAVAEAERMESSDPATEDDETYVFTQIDIENEAPVHRCACPCGTCDRTVRVRVATVS